MTLPLVIGALAGIFQAFGYLLYVRLVIKSETSPNGMSWLMWAYGTLVYFFIEFKIDSPVSVLLLPAICVASAVLVSVYSFFKASYIPPQRSDYVALFVDITLMFGFVALTALAHFHRIGSEQHVSLALLFLMLTSASTLVTFYPIMRTTFTSPYNEKPLPWFVWSVAYGLLLYTTVAEDLEWEYTVYPIMNLVLHTVVGIFALTDESRELPWKKNYPRS